jgi:hypothetical protein
VSGANAVSLDVDSERDETELGGDNNWSDIFLVPFCAGPIEFGWRVRAREIISRSRIGDSGEGGVLFMVTRNEDMAVG